MKNIIIVFCVFLCVASLVLDFTLLLHSKNMQTEIIQAEIKADYQQSQIDTLNERQSKLQRIVEQDFIFLNDKIN